MRCCVPICLHLFLLRWCLVSHSFAFFLHDSICFYNSVNSLLSVESCMSIQVRYIFKVFFFLNVIIFQISEITLNYLQLLSIFRGKDSSKTILETICHSKILKLISFIFTDRIVVEKKFKK